jgi:hypothetical protein
MATTSVMPTPPSGWTHHPYGHQALEPRRFVHDPYATQAIAQPIEESLDLGIHLLDQATGLLLKVEIPVHAQGVEAIPSIPAPWMMEDPVPLVLGQLPNKKLDRAAVVRTLVALAAGLEFPLTGRLSIKMPGPFIAKITVPRHLAARLQQLSDRYHALSATFVPGPSRPISVQVDPQ